MSLLYIARLLAAVTMVWTLVHTTAALAAPASSVRLIVKFKSTTAKVQQEPRDRVGQLGALAATELAYVRPMALDAHVVALPDVGSDLAGAMVADAVVARLGRLPDVEYVVRSQRRHALRTANDTYFPDQFYLNAGSTTIDATGAWDVTTGVSTTIIAIVDTGLLAHADLAGRTVQGYDFITAHEVANDGDGRDADATDPGDWFSGPDFSNPYFAPGECVAAASSWHGTAVAGVVAANTDNNQWLSGVDWHARLLPVRVLGKCGGDDADIIDGLAWAGGLAVPGVPMNAHPAHVINMSLGSAGLCPQAYTDVVAQILAHGVTRAIVAAAGNDGSQLAQTPGGCDGVISVASTTYSGNRASYSSYGLRTDLAAPGGDGGSSAYNLLSLDNSGSSTPGADAVAFYAGTSFSAPLVTGTAALLLSVAPALNAAEVREVLRGTAKPFPAGSTCTTKCGTGILDAASAVRTAKSLAGPITAVDLIEFYNAAFDHYFITWVPTEIARLDSGALVGWTRTGKTFRAFSTVQSGTNGVCRIYIPPGLGDGHYYGRDQFECESTAARNPSFVLEAAQFFYLYPAAAGNCSPGQAPVYRVFSNRADANHRYTTERAVRGQMVARGWLAEGDGPDTVVMCAPL
jgi:serine protease